MGKALGTFRAVYLVVLLRGLVPLRVRHRYRRRDPHSARIPSRKTLDMGRVAEKTTVNSNATSLLHCWLELIMQLGMYVCTYLRVSSLQYQSTLHSFISILFYSDQ
ncbi:hypothetical protein T310_9386 [Rasamsonia emersonii CBS 393.64]|uniref:Uncharacterized protein n=1 Tax=Rasamsonia emersonii (strain ATCC 16479 / CBS 393.64 / IMI 116815) TaxID=1408163 RepID=A0A0F4YFT9_RASE3|nr:hypothetical protein T310_9386 [Rasamsonia emersonii CBS 393.64]KKA16980.1 hypothetical protein T310_9386 [Rasamsonia emersonii CBS 393.64]